MAVGARSASFEIRRALDTQSCDVDHTWGTSPMLPLCRFFLVCLRASSVRNDPFLPPFKALTATQSEEPVVPASAYRSLQSQVRELQRLLGKKTMEAEILKEALEKSRRGQKIVAVAVVAEGRFP